MTLIPNQFDEMKIEGIHEQITVTGGNQSLIGMMVPTIDRLLRHGGKMKHLVWTSWANCMSLNASSDVLSINEEKYTIEQ